MIHDVEYDLGAQWSKRLVVGLLDWKKLQGGSELEDLLGRDWGRSAV